METSRVEILVYYLTVKSRTRVFSTVWKPTFSFK